MHSTPTLLHYRPWQGQLGGSWRLVWPIARVSLAMILRRKLFWIVYALSLTLFLMFFFGQYLLAWAESQSAEQSINIPGFRNPQKTTEVIDYLKNKVKLNGSPETYQRFINLQAKMVMIVLAMAGSILVGNDFRFGTLPFYLSKPLNRWHYLIGKCLAVAAFVNLVTTLPALALFAQYGMLGDNWEYFLGEGKSLELGGLSVTTPVNPLLFGILGYGVVLTLCLSLMLVAIAVWLRKTVPMIMIWTTVFVFLPEFTFALVDGLHYSPGWRLLDIWNNMFLVGSYLLGLGYQLTGDVNQPPVYAAGLVLLVVCATCLIYLNLRIRAVEVVR